MGEQGLSIRDALRDITNSINRWIHQKETWPHEHDTQKMMKKPVETCSQTARPRAREGRHRPPPPVLPQSIARNHQNINPQWEQFTGWSTICRPQLPIHHTDKRCHQNDLWQSPNHLVPIFSTTGKVLNFDKRSVIRNTAAQQNLDTNPQWEHTIKHTQFGRTTLPRKNRLQSRSRVSIEHTVRVANW